MCDRPSRCYSAIDFSLKMPFLASPAFHGVGKYRESFDMSLEPCFEAFDADGVARRSHQIMNCFQHLSESRGATDKPPRGGATKKKADSTTPHALSASNTHAHHNQAHCTTALAHLPSLLTERATHAHPLHPAALAFVPYGIVLVRVRVPP